MEENPLVPDYILKKIILLYGANTETLFKIQSGIEGPLSNVVFENYFLINGEWINKFKEFYNYNQIANIIQQSFNNFHNYYQFKNCIEQILNLIKTFQIRQKEKEFPIELKRGTGTSFCSKSGTAANNVYYHNNFYIVNSELNELLKQDKENPTEPNYSVFVNKTPQKIFLHNKYLYLIFGCNKIIEICDINNEGMFSSHYSIKLGKGDEEQEINNIIKLGGIEQFVKSKKFFTNDISGKYDAFGGLIFNTAKIQKEEKKKLEEQNEKNNIHHSITTETMPNFNNNEINNNPVNNPNVNSMMQQNNMNNNQQRSYDNYKNNSYNQALNPNNVDLSGIDQTKMVLLKMNNNPIMDKTIFDSQQKNNINNYNNNIPAQNNYIQQNNNQFPQQINNNQNQNLLKHSFNANSNSNTNNYQNPGNFQNKNFSSDLNGFQQNNNFNTPNQQFMTPFDNNMNMNINMNNNMFGQQMQMNNMNNNINMNNMNPNNTNDMNSNNLNNMNPNNMNDMNPNNMNDMNSNNINNMNANNMNDMNSNNLNNMNPNNMNDMNPNNMNDMNSNNINNMNANNMNDMNSNNLNNLNMNNINNMSMNNMNNLNMNNMNLNDMNMNNMNMNNMNNLNMNNMNLNNMNMNNMNMNNMNIMNNNIGMNIINNNMIINNNINNNKYPPNNSNNSNIFYNNITSLKEMKYVPKIGLENLGQTCYMNSVLQCFSNLYHITNYFLNPQKQELIKNHMKLTDRKEDSLLCFAFKELIDNLWKGVPNQSFSPKKFKKRLEKLNPLFAANTAGDSKDFANYLIIELHEELNLIETNPVAGSIQNMENINPLNQEEVFKAFMSKFAIENYSIISNNFYGVTQGQFECQRCKMKLLNKGIPSSPIKYNYENFFYLEFPLDEVRKYIAKQNNSFQYYQNITEVNIFDCFNYHTKLNSIIGYCDKCKVDNAQINSRNTIFSPSKILMLIFNRGKGIQYKIKINFPIQLNISNIVTNSMNQYYDLQGVVKHFGESNSYGHFMAYCRPPVPMYHDQWYCFNDQTVVEVNDMNDIVEKGDTYILFYELKNIKQ